MAEDVQITKLSIEVDASAESASAGLDRLVASLNKLKTATAGVSSSAKRLGELRDVLSGLGANSAVASLEASIKALSDKIGQLSSKIPALNSGIRAVDSSSSRAAISTKKLSSAVSSAGLYYAFTRVLGVIGEFVDKSNSYIEDTNLFTVAMGRYADSASKYAQKVSSIMGIDVGDWMRNTGIFQTLITGFGVVDSRAEIMSRNLTQLGYDISSFFNISVEDAMQKLQSGIAGELEPLRRLGYDLSQARLEQEALNLGIEKSFINMTQAEKAQLRYYTILNQVTVAQGDMARTLEAPANQLRILSAQATMAARAIGNIFIPVLNATLPYAIAFLQVIRDVASAIASLFGFSMPTVDYSSGIGSLASGAAEAEDSLGGAAAAAKKLKDYTLGFDELNILRPDTSGSGSAGGGYGVAGGGFDFELPEYDFLGGLEENANKARDAVEKLLLVLAPFAALMLAEKVSRWSSALTTLTDSLPKKGILNSLLTGFSAFTGQLKSGSSVFKSLSAATKAFRNNLSLLSKVTIGGAGAVGAFMLLNNAVKDVLSGQRSLAEVLPEVAFGITAIGLALNAAIGPIGWVVTGVSALAGVLAALDSTARENAEAAFMATENYEALNSILAENEWALSNCTSSSQSLKNSMYDLNSAMSTFDSAAALADKIFDLSEKTNRTAYETSLLQNYVEAFNALGLENISLEYDSLTGTASGTRSEVQGLIEDQRTLALESAKTSLLQAFSEQALNFATAIESAKRGFSEASAIYNEAMAEMQAMNEGEIEFSSKRYNELMLTAEEAAAAAEDSKNTLAELSSAIDTASGQFRDFAKIVGLDYNFESAQEQLAGLSLGFLELGYDMDPVILSLTGMDSAVATSTGNIIKHMGDMESRMKDDLEKTKTHFDDTVHSYTLRTSELVDQMAESSSAIRSEYARVAESVESESQRMADAMYDGVMGGLTSIQQALNGMQISGGKVSVPNVKRPKVAAFASGGFPEDGLFFANSNELVGQFTNGRTAVANNTQIIAGISDGVEAANAPLIELIEAFMAMVQNKPSGFYINGRAVYNEMRAQANASGYQISPNTQFR